MNLCVIGGSGFLGTHFFEITINDINSNLKNLDKQQSKCYSEITSIVDVRDQESLNNTLKGQETVVLLAAEHRDDVSPISLYYDVNVQGTKNVLSAMDLNLVRNIIFTSSVAVYGLDKINPNEMHPAEPFNHYGITKWQAEEILREWYNIDPINRSLIIIRPTVIFGENNRGNVYNLLKQISSGIFLMIGKGENKKSMAYVKNVAAFINYHIKNTKPGYQVFNYVDKPDFTINDLVGIVEKSLNKHIPSIRIPRWIGLIGGFGFDILSALSHKKYPISSIRIKKFCAVSQFDSSKTHASGFKAPYTLAEGLQNTLFNEFIKKHSEKRVLFENE